MIKKLAVAAAIAGASIATAAPASSAATRDFGGVHPSQAAAEAFCKAGQQDGRWNSCSYERRIGGGGVWLWVYA
ncbi:hypothetical protein ACWEV3_34015 [Saccharopolyspora sp. NPDC003752]